MNVDVMVIGAGPAGATAALLLARQGARVGLVDPLGIGGQLINVEHIPDYPGFPSGVAGWDLAAAMGEQVLDAGVELLLGSASAIKAAGPGSWRVQVGITGHPARAVLLASGCRPQPLPGAEKLQGRGVSYCAACDAALFAGRRVVVVGGGDVALAEAISLAAVAQNVAVLFPGASPSAGLAWQRAATARANVRMVPRAQILGVNGEGGIASGVDYLDQATGERRQISAEGIFGALTGIPNNQLVIDFAASGSDGGVVAAQSSIPGQDGLFVAGEVRSGTARRAVAAAGDGANAAIAIATYLHGRP